MSRRNDLLALLATRSAKRGTFTLASGRQSSLYIDARITTMSPEGLSLIGPLGFEAIRDARVGRRRGRRADAGRRPDRLRDQLRERVDRRAAARVHRSQGAEDARHGQADRGAVPGRAIASSSSKTRSRPAARREKPSTRCAPPAARSSACSRSSIARRVDAKRSRPRVLAVVVARAGRGDRSAASPRSDRRRSLARVTARIVFVRTTRPTTG